MNSRMCSTRASYGRPRNLTQSLRVPEVIICCGSIGGSCGIGGVGSTTCCFGSIALFRTCKSIFSYFPYFSTRVIYIYLLHFSNCTSKKFYIAASNAISVFTQCLHSIFFLCKKNECIPGCPTIWFFYKQNAIFPIQYMTGLLP